MSEQMGNATKRLRDHMMATWTNPFIDDTGGALSTRFKQYLGKQDLNWTYNYLDEGKHMPQLLTMAEQLGNVPTLTGTKKVTQDLKARNARMRVVEHVFNTYGLEKQWYLDVDFTYSTRGQKLGSQDGPCFRTKQESIAELPHADTFVYNPFAGDSCGSYHLSIVNDLAPPSLNGYLGTWYKQNFCLHIMPENKLWASETTTEALKSGSLAFAEFYYMFDNCDTQADDYSVTRALGQSDRCYEESTYKC